METKLINDLTSLRENEFKNNLKRGKYFVECFSPYGQDCIYNQGFRWNKRDENSIFLLKNLLDTYPKNRFAVLIDDYSGLKEDEFSNFFSWSKKEISNQINSESIDFISEYRLAQDVSGKECILKKISDKSDLVRKNESITLFIDDFPGEINLSKTRRKELRRRGISLVRNGRPSCVLLECLWHNSQANNSSYFKILPRFLKHQQQEVVLILNLIAEANVKEYTTVFADLEDCFAHKHIYRFLIDSEKSM